MKIAMLAQVNSIHTKRWCQWLVDHGIDVLPIGVADVGHIRFMLDAFEPDIFHSIFVSIWGITAHDVGFHPHVVTVIGSDILQKQQYEKDWPRVGQTLRAADHVIGLSQELLDGAIQAGADPSKSSVIPWGVDTNHFKPAYSPLKRRLHKSATGKVVVSTRYLDPLYNHETIMRAFKLILDDFPGSELVFQTAGGLIDYQEKLTALAEELGISDNVLSNREEFPVSRLPQIYNAADVVMSIPDTDGQSLTNLEAMACGVPIVALNNKTNREILPVDWLVDPHNVKEVAGAMLRILHGKFNKNRLRAHRKLVQEKFERDAMMEKAVDLYKSLL